jgi:uncharacterized tellurite resistance protein B-like protein
MKRLLEAEDVAAVMERAAQTVPSALRPSTFALVADLLLADGKMDARERKFLHHLAANFNLRPRMADDVIAAILVKNHL